MKLTDYDPVIQLWKNTAGMGLNDVDDSPAGIEKFLSRNPNTCFVAEDESGIIGTVLCGHDGRRAMIYHAAVAENKRNFGVGKALINAVTDALKREGIQKVSLVVMRKNELGNAFWTHMGFPERIDLVFRSKSLMD